MRSLVRVIVEQVIIAADRIHPFEPREDRRGVAGKNARRAQS
jgi:hypothetical protein